MDPQDARRSSSLPVIAEACGNGSERIGRAVSLFEEPFHAAESMTIRGEEGGQSLITVDGVSMDWRSSLAVRNHYGGSVAAELALGIELPDATWPQSLADACATCSMRRRRHRRTEGENEPRDPGPGLAGSENSGSVSETDPVNGLLYIYLRG